MKISVVISRAAAGAMLLSCLTFNAYAADQAVKAANKDDLIAASSAIHKQMVPGGRYEFLTPAEKGLVDTKLGEMQSLFEKYGTVASMSQDSKIQLFNDQESVNTVLTHRDADRRICKSVAPLGSNIPKTTCHTYREVEESQRDSENYMRDNQLHSPQLKSGG